MKTPAHGNPTTATPSKGTNLVPVAGTIGGHTPPTDTPVATTPPPLPPTPTPSKGTAVVAPPSHGPTAPHVHLPGLTPAPAPQAKRPVLPQPHVDLSPAPATPPPPMPTAPAQPSNHPSWYNNQTPPKGMPAAMSTGSQDREKLDGWTIVSVICSVLTVALFAFIMTMVRCDLDDIKDNQSEMKTDIAKIKGAVIATDSKGEQVTVISALTGINAKIDGLAKATDLDRLAKTSELDDLSAKLDGLATKRDLQGLARKSDLDGLSTNPDPSGLATTTDINNLNAKIDGLSGIALETNKVVKERANAKPRVVVVRAVQPKKVVKK